QRTTARRGLGAVFNGGEQARGEPPGGLGSGGQDLLGHGPSRQLLRPPLSRRHHAPRLYAPSMILRLGSTRLPMVGRARLYVCGITPYDTTHLGHAATFVWADVVVRLLQHDGLE